MISGLSKGNYKAYVVTMELIPSSPPLMSSPSTFVMFMVGYVITLDPETTSGEVTRTVPFIVGMVCGFTVLALLLLLIVVFIIFRYNSYK